jgi:hypothetical protein
MATLAFGGRFASERPTLVDQFTRGENIGGLEPVVASLNPRLALGADNHDSEQFEDTCIDADERPVDCRPGATAGSPGQDLTQRTSG